MSLELIDSKNAALLVIDLQNAFCHPDGTLGKSGVDTDRLGAIVPTLREVIGRFKSARIPVIWTVQEHLEVDRRRGRKRLPSHTSKRKQVSALAGSWDSEIIQELNDLADDPTLIVRKHRFGAFYNTRLEILLEMLGVEALFVAGLTTNACVDTTFREAYLRDYDVIGIDDCIAGVNPEWEAIGKEVWRQYLGITATASDVARWIEDQQKPRAIGLAHMLLQVSDLQASQIFYLDLLGFQKKPNAVPLADGRPLIVTSQGLGLTEGGPGDMKQVDHIAFEVQNVSELAAHLKKNGVNFVKDLAQGAYGLTIYVSDPDGNIVELFEKNG